MTVLKKISQRVLAELEESNLSRDLFPSERQSGIYIIRNGKKLLSFCCNDYFGLSQHPKVIQSAITALQKYGAGAGASRLVTGNHPYYAKLEKNIAKMKKTEAACVFGSGYLANIGTIQALVGKSDLVIADRFVHACIIDGVRLSGAKLLRFRHNDAAHLKSLLEKNRASYSNCMIITETIFSMDGDLPPLSKIVTLAQQYDCWTMTDDAHGIGINTANNKVDIQMGTLSKATGAYGGYVAAKKEVIAMIVNTARSLIYSTALPPSVVASANTALEIMAKEESRTKKPMNMAKLFCKELGLPTPHSQIVPIIIGEEKKALNASKKLESYGFLVSAIRPPTVPTGTARLRISFSALHNAEQVKKLAVAIKKLRIIR